MIEFDKRLEKRISRLQNQIDKQNKIIDEATKKKKDLMEELKKDQNDFDIDSYRKFIDAAKQKNKNLKGKELQNFLNDCIGSLEDNTEIAKSIEEEKITYDELGKNETSENDEKIIDKEISDDEVEDILSRIGKE